MTRLWIPVAALISISSVLVACGADGTEVNVTLSEYVVEPEDDSADAGEITFRPENEGGETHEFLVVEAASADELPTDEDGAFDEEAFGEDNVLGEVEDIGSGDDGELTLDLEAGSYVLMCNLVEEEDGETESHFAEGMHAQFTVD
jgi:uncharacterized cupredoxin-like copper-binding protein